MLGPLLFNVYIDDVVDFLKVDCYLYADDLKMFATIRNYSDCRDLQSGLIRLDSWCGRNNLELNVKKCAVMTYGKLKSPLIYNYDVNGVTLQRPDTFCDLGVYFDGHLTFVPHVSSVISAASKRLGLILRNSTYFSNVNTLSILFNSLVRSKLEYASIVWAPIYTVHSKALEQVQRRFLKFMSFKIGGIYPPRGVDHQTLLDEFGCLSLRSRRQLRSLLILFDLVHHRLNCLELESYLVPRVSNVPVRYPLTFEFPRPKTNILIASPLYQMLKNYEIIERQCDIFNCSKAELKSCFLVSLRDV